MLINLKNYFRNIGFLSCFIGGIFIGLTAIPAYWVITGLFGGRRLQNLYASNQIHQASLLKKYNLADINFVVKVDGNKVFVSPDYANMPDHLYRETLVWDKTGKVVVLELMGKRVFAYNAEEKRELEKGEILNYQLSPVISDNNFYAPIKDIEE